MGSANRTKKPALRRDGKLGRLRSRRIAGRRQNCFSILPFPDLQAASQTHGSLEFIASAATSRVAPRALAVDPMFPI